MRKQKLSRDVERQIVTLRGLGIDVEEISARLGLHQEVIRRALQECLPDDPPDEPEIVLPDRRRRLRSSTNEEN